MTMRSIDYESFSFDCFEKGGMKLIIRGLYSNVCLTFFCLFSKSQKMLNKIKIESWKFIDVLLLALKTLLTYFTSRGFKIKL